MTKREVSFSDLSGQMAGSPDGLIPLVVTDHPNSDPDQRVRIEVTQEEMEKIGKMAIDAVGLETEPTDEEERRTRFVVPVGKLATLATVGPRWKKSSRTPSQLYHPKPKSVQMGNDVHTTNGLMAVRSSTTTSPTTPVFRTRERSGSKRRPSFGTT